jgi:hypothetical protein
MASIQAVQGNNIALSHTGIGQESHLPETEAGWLAGETFNP